MKPGFKPMLASTVDDTSLLTFPLLASPKLDGIRAVVGDGKLLSRNLKDIPNHYSQMMFGVSSLNNMDGELVVGSACGEGVFNRTSSGVMSREGVPDVTFYVFDSFTDPRSEFVRRHASLKTRLSKLKFAAKVVVVPHVEVNSLEELTTLEAKWLAQGFEGVMLRSRNGEYKYGRSTPTQGWLMKLKQFADSEAVIVDIEEQMANTNEATKDALGRTERSSKKAGLKGKGTLGSLLVKDMHTGVVFNIGTGMSDELRASLWDVGLLSLRTRVVKYSYFPSGSKEKPRFPVFIGFRDPIDL